MILDLVWVAAHHGLRRHAVARTMPPDERARMWRLVHEVTVALGRPPAPGWVE